MKTKSFSQSLIFRTRRVRKMLVAGVLLLCTAVPFATFGQGPGKKIGKVSDLFNQPQAVGKASAPLKISTGEGDLHVNVGFEKKENNKHQIAGTIPNAPGSNVSITITDGVVQGTAVIPSEEKAYTYSSDAEGNVYVENADIHKLLCVNYNTAAAASTAAPAPPPGDPVYNLQSLPGAVAVVKLDFDGEYVVDPAWNGGNPINADPALLSADEILEVFKLMSEDFRPFQLNITTSEAVYQAAPANRRMRVIFTPTNTAAPGSGGVAYVGSFTWGTGTPCWVFNSGIKGAGEAGSHETGHTLGLIHDGREIPGTGHEEYYAGQGIWAPIMGVGYYRDVVQWSKGEYQYANNQEDDIAIITAQNGFTFRTDDVGNTPATSKAIVADGSGNIVAANNYGIVTTSTDVDVYSFTLSTQRSINLAVKPSPSYPDLDILATLTNAAGTTLKISNPTDKLDASIFITLPAGTYYLTIDGTGNRNPFTDGYSDYASIGEYNISGTLNLPAGINGPSCVQPSITYTFILNPTPSTNITNITWWVNGDAVISVDPTDNKVVNVTVTPNNPGTISIAAQVNYSTSPWSQNYTKFLQVGGCPSTARTGQDDNNPDNTSAVSSPAAATPAIVSMQVFDITGQEVISANGISKEEVLASKDLKTGLYILRYVTESGEYFTEKVFKGDR